MVEARGETPALVALTREVGPALADCELTYRSREPFDLGRAREQHRAYEDALERLGCTVHRLPADPDAPDCVFVEDTAVVLDDVAVIARPGAASRRRETAPVAAALSAWRDLASIEPPGTLDGGDVLRCGDTLFVGRSTRTNDAGAEQLRRLAEARGLAVVRVPLRDCLHLKSAATSLGGGRLLACPDRVDPAAFAGREIVPVAPGEPDAANVLAVAGAILCDVRFPATARRLERLGLRVVPVDGSELAKAEGGLTCCSIVVEGSTQSSTATSTSKQWRPAG